jgi:hypothetical protein
MPSILSSKPDNHHIYSTSPSIEVPNRLSHPPSPEQNHHQTPCQLSATQATDPTDHLAGNANYQKYGEQLVNLHTKWLASYNAVYRELYRMQKMQPLPTLRLRDRIINPFNAMLKLASELEKMIRGTEEDPLRDQHYNSETVKIIDEELEYYEMIRKIDEDFDDLPLTRKSRWKEVLECSLDRVFVPS